MNFKGLTDEEVKKQRAIFGRNILFVEKRPSFLKKVWDVITEPMFLLLLAAATIYFFLGEPTDGLIMLIFVVGMITIETIQEWKTDKTLKALKDLSSPKVHVVRNHKQVEIDSADLVPEDIMVLFEGTKIPADGVVIENHGLCVDESSLTGEAEGKWKKAYENAEEGYFKDYMCYAGTLCLQGQAYVRVEKTGKMTEYGKIGNAVLSEKPRKTLLEKQTDRLVRICAILALILFLAVSVTTFFISQGDTGTRIIDSILSGITLAMAMIPEEFPVILTIFLSMGAWRLAKNHALVKRLSAVETLGAVSTLCVDKTGTITKNQMTVDDFVGFDGASLSGQARKVACAVAAAASLKEAFDPMEKAIWGAANSMDSKPSGTITHPFPFSDTAKMMGNVYKTDIGYELSMKGAFESILRLCPSLSQADIQTIREQAQRLSKKGLRVLGLAHEVSPEPIHSLQNRQMQFLGFVSFIDPERDGIRDDITTCYRAGIRVVMITGDNGYTASAIAERIGIKNASEFTTGEEIEKMSEDDLKKRLVTCNIFSRVIPEHKLRIVKCLQSLGEVVAMTGDGVNDAPALKTADIGIAMGKRGSEVSREAAALILLDDNFRTIVNTVKDGRRIYTNITKAIAYVFIIHIPIALSSLVAPMLGIQIDALFLLPVHVVLMELMIDPTCSIVLERQPAESDIMDRGPRSIKEPLVQRNMLVRSILQGVILFAFSFGTYYYFYRQADIMTARSCGLAVLFLGNLFLVDANASKKDLAITTVKKLSRDKVFWFTNIGTVVLLGVILFTPVNRILKLDPLTWQETLITIGLAFVSVFWIEWVKIFHIIQDKLKAKKA